MRRAAEGPRALRLRWRHVARVVVLAVSRVLRVSVPRTTVPVQGASAVVLRLLRLLLPLRLLMELGCTKILVGGYTVVSIGLTLRLVRIPLLR
jgi:hypothetical protein